MSYRLITLIVAVCLACTLSGPALAQHAGDILLEVESGKIVTGLIDEDSGTVTTGVRVFESEFGEIFPNFTDEPGFDNDPGTFPFPSNIGFNILDSLRKWDGSDFDAIPTEQVSIGFGPLTPVATPLAPAIVPGFTLPVAATGDWHRHLEYTLTGAASTGIYLLTLELFSDASGIDKSDPFFLVFNQNDTEENHEAAAEYVETNIVPEPASWVLGLTCVVCLELHRLLRRRAKP